MVPPSEVRAAAVEELTAKLHLSSGAAVHLLRLADGSVERAAALHLDALDRDGGAGVNAATVWQNMEMAERDGKRKGSLLRKRQPSKHRALLQAEAAAHASRKVKRTGVRKAGLKEVPLPMTSRLPPMANDEVPPYAVRDWSKLQKADGLNTYSGGQVPLRCSRERLEFRDRKPGPNGAPVGPCHQLETRSATQTQPVLPTLFVPGFPKCATTWLYECMHAAFVPEAVCDVAFNTGQLQAKLWSEAHPNAPAWAHRSQPPFHQDKWNRTNCGGRRFMLPGIACGVTGGCGHRKELFFYGSARQLESNRRLGQLESNRRLVA
mgnify:CR=1 FL=1